MNWNMKDKKYTLNQFFAVVLVIILPSLFSSLNAQLMIGGGVNSIVAFGVKKPYFGLQIQVEKRDEDQSFYGKISSTLSQKEDDMLITLDPIDETKSQLDVPTHIMYNYTNLEFGKRYYYGDDIDFGYSLFGGSHITLTFNQLRLVTSSYDKNQYIFPSAQATRGSIFGLAAGLNGGIQKGYYFGTIYVDAGLNYYLRAIPSNDLASYTSSFKSVNFVFNVGFKRTLHYSN